MTSTRSRVMIAPPPGPRVQRRRRRRVWLLVLGVVFGSALAIDAWAAPAPPTPQGAAVQQPPVLPLPTVAPPDDCAPACTFPSGTSRPSVPATPLPPITELPEPSSCFPGQLSCTPDGPAPTSEAPSCTGEGCIPQPSTAPPGTGAPPGQPGDGIDDPECGLTNISGCLGKAINSVFRDLVKSAMDPVLKLLGATAFTTPTLDDLPGVTNLWNNSWLVVIALYSGVILVGGIIVMSHESVQNRYTIKEIGPRLVVSFIASALSLFVIDKLIRLANALSAAVLGDGVDPPKLGNDLVQTISGAYSAVASGGLFLILLHAAVVIAVVALLLVYVVRVVIALILIVSAPLWVACHALPHTDGIARWGWRALGATLGIPVAQSLALHVAIDTLFSGSVHLFTSVGGGIGMLFAALGLLFVLFKIPFWFLSAVKLGTGRSFLGGLVKAVIAAKTFGAIAGRTGGFGKAGAAGAVKGGRSSAVPRRGATADPPWPPLRRAAARPDVVNKRLQQQYDAERLRAARRSRPPSQKPRFLQPVAQTPTHDPAISPASPRRSAMPAFSASPPPQPPTRRHGSGPGTPPRFQAPGAAPQRDGQSPARPVRVASVPPQLRFQPPAPDPAQTVPTAKPAQSPPRPPVFRTATPTPRLGDALPRTPSVPPIAFRAPKPTPRGDDPA